ncbi:MAG: hypothetical protein H8K10_11160 [Nitrospira sp.]|nr:hypothetical protein [Nitrospira sp.]
MKEMKGLEAGGWLTRIIHECFRESFETEARRVFSHGAMTKERQVCERR